MCNCNKKFKIIYLGEDLVTDNKKKVTETLPITIDLKEYFSDYLNMPDQEVEVDLIKENGALIGDYKVSLIGGQFFLQVDSDPPTLISDAEFTIIPEYTDLDYGKEVNVRFDFHVDGEICNYVIEFERLFNVVEGDCLDMTIDIPDEGSVDISNVQIETYDLTGNVIETFNYIDKNNFKATSDYISFKITNGSYVMNYNQISLCRITNCYISNISDHFCSECFEPCKDDCNETENDIRRYKLNRINSLMFTAMNYGMVFNSTFKYLDLYSTQTDYISKYSLYSELRDMITKCTGCDENISTPTEDCEPCKNC